MSTVLLPEKVTVSTRAIFQEIENEIVILDLAQEKYYGLDDIGPECGNSFQSIKIPPSSSDISDHITMSMKLLCRRILRLSLKNLEMQAC